MAAMVSILKEQSVNQNYAELIMEIVKKQMVELELINYQK